MIKNRGRRYGKIINGNAVDFQEQEYSLICDECGKEIPDFKNFIDAVSYERSHDWRCINKNGEWKDVCQSCYDKKTNKM